MSEKQVGSGKWESREILRPYTTTGTSFDAMIRWSEVTSRSRSTRAVATIARSAGSRRLASGATSEATWQVSGRIRNTGLVSNSLKNSSKATFSRSLPSA